MNPLPRTAVMFTAVAAPMAAGWTENVAAIGTPVPVPVCLKAMLQAGVVGYVYAFVTGRINSKTSAFARLFLSEDSVKTTDVFVASVVRVGVKVAAAAMVMGGIAG